MRNTLPYIRFNQLSIWMARFKCQLTVNILVKTLESSGQLAMFSASRKTLTAGGLY